MKNIPNKAASRQIRDIIITVFLVLIFGAASIINGVNVADAKGDHKKHKRHSDGKRIKHSKIEMEFEPVIVKEKASNTFSQFTIVEIRSNDFANTILNASSINNAGKIVGTSRTPGSSCGPTFPSDAKCFFSHAYSLNDGQAMDLTFGLEATHSYAFDINNFDEIVGLSKETFKQTPTFATKWRKGKELLMGSMGGGFSNAVAINDNGKSVGYSDDADIRHAVLWWPDGTIKDLGALPGGVDAYAMDINNNDWIVGYSDKNGDTSLPQAYVIKTNKKNDLKKDVLVMTELTNLNESMPKSLALAINNDNKIVGSSTGSDGNDHAVLWDKAGNIQDLGMLPGATSSVALAINDQGVVVGNSGGRGFVYFNGLMTDLNTVLPGNPGWLIVSAESINANGEIVGMAKSPDGVIKPIMLSPIP